MALTWRNTNIEPSFFNQFRDLAPSGSFDARTAPMPVHRGEGFRENPCAITEPCQNEFFNHSREDEGCPVCRLCPACCIGSIESQGETDPGEPADTSDPPEEPEPADEEPGSDREE